MAWEICQLFRKFKDKENRLNFSCKFQFSLTEIINQPAVHEGDCFLGNLNDFLWCQELNNARIDMNGQALHIQAISSNKIQKALKFHEISLKSRFTSFDVLQIREICDDPAKII